MSVVVILCCIILISLGSSFASSSLPSFVSTFVILPNTKQSISVDVLTSGGVLVECRFDYDTSVGGQKQNSVPVNILVPQMNKKIGCLRFTKEIFYYKICLGGAIEQTAENGDTYTLGKYENIVEGFKTIQTYVGGTFCEAAHAARKAVVEFTCSETVQVTSIDEFAVCQYRVIIGTPDVCGHPQFSVTSRVESWMLEIAETDEGSVVCQAHNNGFDVVAMTPFHGFSLAFTNPLMLSSYVVRKKNRKMIEEEKLTIDVSPARVRATEQLQVDFIKIVAE